MYSTRPPLADELIKLVWSTQKHTTEVTFGISYENKSLFLCLLSISSLKHALCLYFLFQLDQMTLTDILPSSEQTFPLLRLKLCIDFMSSIIKYESMFWSEDKERASARRSVNLFKVYIGFWGTIFLGLKLASEIWLFLSFSTSVHFKQTDMLRIY